MDAPGLVVVWLVANEFESTMLFFGCHTQAFPALSYPTDLATVLLSSLAVCYPLRDLRWPYSVLNCTSSISASVLLQVR